MDALRHPAPQPKPFHPAVQALNTHVLAPTPRPVATPARQGASFPSLIGFVLDGQHHAGRNACDVMIQTFDALAARDASFPERFAALPKHGRTRRYLSKTRDELYPGRPDLCREHSTKLKSSWWVSTNHSRVTIGRIIEMACDVAGLRFGSDLTVNLGD